MSQRFSQDTEYRIVTSTLTGRDLVINADQNRILIPPTFTADNLTLAYERWQEFYISANFSAKLRRADVRPIDAVANAKSSRDFADALDAVLEHRKTMGSRSYRVLEFLVVLRLFDCVVWPQKPSNLLGASMMVPLFQVFDAVPTGIPEILDEFKKVDKAKSADLSQLPKKRLKYLTELILSIGGLRESGDLTPEVLDGRLMGVDSAAAFATLLCRMNQSKYGQSAHAISAVDYGPFTPPAARADDEFMWVRSVEASLEEWRGLCADWFATQRKGRHNRRNTLNIFLDEIVADKHFPRDPLLILKATFIFPVMERIGRGETNASAVKIRSLKLFFDWILDTKCVEEGDDGHPYRIPGFRNPITSLPAKIKERFETHREALPTRYHRMMREIIEEDDYAWAKAFGRTMVGGGGDYIAVRSDETGEWESVWSPVRANAMLIKLELPLRTFQVRMLNSGEADEERFDLSSNRWIPNPHLLSSKSRKGVLRKIWDRDAGKEFAGLYINTNKTMDSLAPADGRGYVIPWQHERVIGIIDATRRWQEKYNPTFAEFEWINLSEHYVRTAYHEDVLRQRGAETFLFRDAASPSPQEPLKSGRLQHFWYGLCEELERRLSALRETGPDGRALKLIERDGRGIIKSAVYDLHSLRVSLLTAWAEQGVSIEILMKVAGHCTAIMTIYYQKYSIGHITALLSEAEVNRMRLEQTNWERFLQSKVYEDVSTIVAWNDIAGLQSLTKGSGASWERRDHGICPVGGSRCHEGGEALESISGIAKYGPVQGGPQNCPRCRFFITGPAFLVGLQSYFNDTGFRYHLAGEKYRESERAFLELDFERKQKQALAEPFMRLRQWQLASSTFDQRTREMNDLALTWHATLRLIDQSRVLLARSDSGVKVPGGPSSFALVTSGTMLDLEFVIELADRSEGEFELIDSICQSAVWFTSIDAAVPNLKRMRYFDLLLKRHGFDVAFVSFTEDEALRIGNEMARFMFTQFGREDTTALMNGKKVLNELGIDREREFMTVFEKQSGRALSRSGRSLLEIAGERA